MTAYEQQYDVYLKEIQAALENACDTYLPEDSRVCQAARYSLMGGGKRIRAVLTLACCDMLGGDWRAAAHFAAAVEMLHCFSLIHDDLPVWITMIFAGASPPATRRLTKQPRFLQETSSLPKPLRSSQMPLFLNTPVLKRPVCLLWVAEAEA